MPDNVKISLQNALVIVGFILTIGISFSAVAGRIGANEDLDLVQSAEIKSLQEKEVTAALQRQENRLMWQQVMDSQVRIELWIKEIEKVEGR
jgi:hypothetical protein